jgi:hypothetical protein
MDRMLARRQAGDIELDQHTVAGFLQVDPADLLAG